MKQTAIAGSLHVIVPVVISSLLISQHQLELSICLLKVNCLHTYEAYVSHDSPSLQHAMDCLWRIWEVCLLLWEKSKRQVCHGTSGINNWAGLMSNLKRNEKSESSKYKDMRTSSHLLYIISVIDMKMIHRSDNQREERLFMKYLTLLSSWRSLQMSESTDMCRQSS